MKTAIPMEARLKAMAAEIMSRFPSIQVLYLFGSHAAGKAKSGSDVDIAVFTDGHEGVMMDLELRLFLQERLNRPVDVVIMQKTGPIIQHEVLRGRIRIFEKDAARRAEYESRSFRAFLEAVHYQRKRTEWSKCDGQHPSHSASAEQPGKLHQ